MIAKARKGYYDDYKSPLAMPIIQLVIDLQAVGQDALAERAKNGEFDSTKAEADEWAASKEGIETFQSFYPRKEFYTFPGSDNPNVD